MKHRELILIKIGGRPAQEPAVLKSLIAEISRLSGERRFVLIHGGGSEVSRISRAFGIEPTFIDGIRQTSEAEMAIIDMGLAGRMNTMILRMALAAGLPAVGISGVDAGLFTGEPVASDNRTGSVTEIRPALIDHLLSGGYLPVISPVSSDGDGGGLNINADDAAMALAQALAPGTVVFLSDIPGVLDGPPDSPKSAVISRLDESRTETLISDGVIAGGMIPKVRNSLEILKSGAGQVIIGDMGGEASLEDLLSGRRGSRFTR